MLLLDGESDNFEKNELDHFVLPMPENDLSTEGSSDDEQQFQLTQ